LTREKYEWEKSTLRIGRVVHADGESASVGCAGRASPSTRILRAKLILEEALEACAALGVSVMHRLEESGEEKEASVNIGALDFAADGAFNLVEVVDACCDVKVVTTGTLVSCGVKDEEAQQVVDFNNLRKFGPGHTIRADGKLVKPPGHPAPDIESVIEMQISAARLRAFAPRSFLPPPRMSPAEIEQQPIHKHTPH
jgi:predicted HAD superfamily Cof-like phosphohydrolase